MTGCNAVDAMKFLYVPARVLYIEAINVTKKDCFEIQRIIDMKRKTDK